MEDMLSTTCSFFLQNGMELYRCYLHLVKIWAQCVGLTTSRCGFCLTFPRSHVDTWWNGLTFLLNSWLTCDFVLLFMQTAAFFKVDMDVYTQISAYSMFSYIYIWGIQSLWSKTYLGTGEDLEEVHRRKNCHHLNLCGYLYIDGLIYS